MDIKNVKNGVRMKKIHNFENLEFGMRARLAHGALDKTTQPTHFSTRVRPTFHHINMSKPGARHVTVTHIVHPKKSPYR